MGPQSLRHALHSLRSLLCRGLTSLLTIHDAESPGMSLRARSQQDCRRRFPPPSPWPRLASPEGLCLLLGEARGGPFTVPSSDGCCPSLLCWDSIPTKHPLGGSASGGDGSQEVIHTNEPKLNLNICFLCNALQKAWHCLLSKSVPSNSGGKKKKTSESEVRQHLLQEGNSPSL